MLYSPANSGSSLPGIVLYPIQKKPTNRFDMENTSHKKNKVPVIITADVDYSKHHAQDDKCRAFDRLIEATGHLGIKTTFFFVAREAEQVPQYPKALAEAGHDVGCHGLTHGDEEEYDSMPVAKQKEYLRQATDIISGLSGQKTVSFRAPRVKISATTYGVLAEEGFIVDSSVCSQRFDLVSSNLFHSGWLTAPRMPYHPSKDSAFRRGDLDILVVPVSAMAAPFISSATYVLGPGIMKMFYRILLAESRRTGKPIVYLYHPYEFAAEIPGAKDYGRNVRVHGFRFRRHLYRGTPDERFDWTVQMLEYMASFDDVEFMTMRQYALQHAQSGDGNQ